VAPETHLRFRKATFFHACCAKHNAVAAAPQTLFWRKKLY
jgi:hypothetical protein